MIAIDNVLVEIQDKDMPFRNPFNVYYHFDKSKKLGECELFLKEDGLYANFRLYDQLPDGIFWPAIGYQTNPNVIDQIGLCRNPNVDVNIPCIPNS